MTRWIMATDHRHGHGLKERRELSGEGATAWRGNGAPMVDTCLNGSEFIGGGTER